MVSTEFAPTHPWRRAVLISLVGLIVTGVIGAAFAWLLQATGDWRVGLGWERALLLSIDRDAPAVIDWVMLGLPWLGTNLTLFPLIALFSLWVWRRRGRGELALELMIVELGSMTLNLALKAAFDRPRPELWPHRGQFQYAAYPSGHAIVGIAVFFTIALMLYRERHWRWPYVVAVTMLAVSLYSRLYLGVHWPTDVLGGLLLGAVWLAIVQYAFRPFRERSARTGRDAFAPANLPAAARRSPIEDVGRTI